MIIPKDNYKLVISYDFGTTFSGASYAFTHTTASSTPEVHDIQKWPHKGGNYYPKTPTLLVYKRSDPQVLIEWGHGAKRLMLKPQAAKENIILSNFKLNLDKSLSRGIAENHRSSVDNIADYLKVMHEYVLKELARGFAQNYDPSTFRYCLTVPAMWSDLAKQSMRKAAIKAGLIQAQDPSDRLVLISEPEAAALYCQRMCCDHVNLKKGDTMMVCDAGGGTVDLIVFQVLEDHAQNNNRLKEVTKGMGESCGSVFLDSNFKRFLEKKLGMDQMNSLPPSAVNHLMDQFIDNIKPEFDGLDDQYLNMPSCIDLVEVYDGCVDEGTLVLRANELKEHVFDPIIDRVLGLLEKQYQQVPDRKITCIFLVGGFGSSNYLFQRIQQAFEGRVGQVLCPPRAAMAVVRGAVYFGLNPHLITSRVSRRTYGINAGLPFDDRLDPPSSKVIRPDGSVKCTSRFLTFVKKGDVLPVDHCLKESMFVYYGTIKVTDIILYAKEGDGSEPRYIDEPEVDEVAAIQVPIPIMPNAFVGERLAYTVRMYFGLTEIRIETDFGTGTIYKAYCDFDAINRYDGEDE